MGMFDKTVRAGSKSYGNSTAMNALSSFSKWVDKQNGAADAQAAQRADQRAAEQDAAEQAIWAARNGGSGWTYTGWWIEEHVGAGEFLIMTWHHPETDQRAFIKLGPRAAKCVLEGYCPYLFLRDRLYDYPWSESFNYSFGNFVAQCRAYIRGGEGEPDRTWLFEQCRLYDQILDY